MVCRCWLLLEVTFNFWLIGDVVIISYLYLFCSLVTYSVWHNISFILLKGAELAAQEGKSAAALAACKTLAEELSETRFPAPRILSFKVSLSLSVFLFTVYSLVKFCVIWGLIKSCNSSKRIKEKVIAILSKRPKNVILVTSKKSIWSKNFFW
jgi:hypothetical protein